MKRYKIIETWLLILSVQMMKEKLEDGVAFELYWAEFDHNDIKRESVGQHVNG